MAESTMHADSQHLMHDDSPQQLRYYYLDKRVKGESVRLALVVGGIEFEDVRLTYEEVQNMRAAGKLPFSQVPALQIGSGEDAPIWAQSQALLRWAGRKGGLYPEEHQLLIDAVTDVMVELYTEMIKVGYGPVSHTMKCHEGAETTSPRGARFWWAKYP
jgi:glutathione S-transferase